MHKEDVEVIGKRRLCWRCTEEQVLRAEVRQRGKKGFCWYCETNQRSIRISELADRIEGVFEEHYTVTPMYPEGLEAALHHDKESDYEWEREGESTVYAIMNAAQIPESAAEDVQRILADRYSDFDAAAMGEETEFSEDCYYEQSPASDSNWQSLWSRFEHSLKTEARFMSRSAYQKLESVFKDVHSLKTWHGRPFVMDVGPGTAIPSLHRARVFQAEPPLREALARPDLHIGPPPAKFAAAGRMNAKGIAVFYGANDPKAALAEVRPPVGSRVAIAEFEIIRPLKLLDLEAMKQATGGGSLFDPNLSELMGKAKFLRALSARITQPVMPDDQDMEYLATQAIADYLATEYDPPLDGIAFPSVQAGEGKVNAVLFHKSSRVERIEVAAGTTFETVTGMQYEEGWETEYTVTETYPAEKKSRDKKEKSVWDDENFHFRIDYEEDFRDVSLRVRRDNVSVHHVDRIEVLTTSHIVRHHRWEKTDTEF